MVAYYISSTRGAAENDGRSADTPWNSFSNLSQITLQAGDHILLERGSTFTETLIITDSYNTADAPLLISAYGEGDLPRLSSENGSGIYAARTEYVQVENISFDHTTTSAITGRNSHNWIIQNNTFSQTGGDTTQYGAVNWRDGSNILIENNSFDHIYGDSVFMQRVDHVVVNDNSFDTIYGSNADHIQIEGDHVSIERNLILFGAESDGTKGNVVFQGDGLYAHDNYLEGGSFGFSISADHAVLEGNTIKNHNLYSWSSGILIGDQATGDLFDGLAIQNNHFSGSPNAISFYGASETVYSSNVMDVNNLAITGNIFHDWNNKAVKFTNVTPSGTYSDNIYYQEYDPALSNSYAMTDYSYLVQENNVYVPPTVNDLESATTLSFTVSGKHYDGAPILKVYYNDILLLQTEVLADAKIGETETHTLTLNPLIDTDFLSFQFTNDKYNSSTLEDRNLYLHDVRINDQDVPLQNANLNGNLRYYDSSDKIGFLSNGTATLSGYNTTQSSHVPDTDVSEQIFLNITASADLYNGPAEMQIYRNGTFFDKVYVSAEYRLGEDETFSIVLDHYQDGDQFAIKFTNDKYNYKTHEDMNLYVHAVDIGGHAIDLTSVNISGQKVFYHAEDGLISYKTRGTISFDGISLPTSASHPVDETINTLDINDILDQESFLFLQNEKDVHIGAGADQQQDLGSFLTMANHLSDLDDLLAATFSI